MNNFEDYYSNFQKFFSKNNKEHMMIKFEVDPALLKFMMLTVWYLHTEYDFDLYLALESKEFVRHWAGCQKIVDGEFSRKGTAPNAAHMILEYLNAFGVYNFYSEGEL
jgi:hypothetical protein